jgi:hypothetical protein
MDGRRDGAGRGEAAISSFFGGGWATFGGLRAVVETNRGRGASRRRGLWKTRKEGIIYQKNSIPSFEKYQKFVDSYLHRSRSVSIKLRCESRSGAWLLPCPLGQEIEAPSRYAMYFRLSQEHSRSSATAMETDRPSRGNRYFVAGPLRRDVRADE